MSGGYRMTQAKLAGALALMVGLITAGYARPSCAQDLFEKTPAPSADPTTRAKGGGTHKRDHAASVRKKAQARTADGKADAPKAEPWMAVDPSRATHASGDAPLPAEPKSVVSHYGTNEPLEVGGKWSGSNDTAEKTRVENYNAGAAGSGGEVGLKMHF